MNHCLCCNVLGRQCGPTLLTLTLAPNPTLTLTLAPTPTLISTVTLTVTLTPTRCGPKLQLPMPGEEHLRKGGAPSRPPAPSRSHLTTRTLPLARPKKTAQGKAQGKVSSLPLTLALPLTLRLTLS